jgi:hypothetical protein
MNPNNDFQQNYGFSQTTTGTWSLDGNRTPVPDKISNPFPVVLKPRGNADGLLTYVGRSFNFVNPKFEIPHVDMFSFSIQRAITSRSTLDLTYSGSRGKRLQTTKPYNDVEDASFRDNCNYMLGGDRRYCDEQLPNPFKSGCFLRYHSSSFRASSRRLWVWPQARARSRRAASSPGRSRRHSS